MGLKHIKMLVMDVDGVLTDAKIVFNEEGVKSQAFNVIDGTGIKYLIRAGIKTAVITGRGFGVIEHRARQLGIPDVYQGVDDKLPALSHLLKKHRLKPSEVCYIGDDLMDIPVMRQVGYPVAVRNARPEVKRYARYITRNEGGNGAVRELAEKILKAQGRWAGILKRYI